MTQNQSDRATVNIPLIGLWVAAAAVLGGGYWLLTASNSAQVDLYTAQSADTGAFLAAQSGTTIGGTLIAVGVLGVLIAILAQVVVRAAAHVAAAGAARPVDSAGSGDSDDLDDDDFDDIEDVAEADVPSKTTVATDVVDDEGRAAGQKTAP